MQSMPLSSCYKYHFRLCCQSARAVWWLTNRERLSNSLMWSVKSSGSPSSTAAIKFCKNRSDTYFKPYITHGDSSHYARQRQDFLHKNSSLHIFDIVPGQCKLPFHSGKEELTERSLNSLESPNPGSRSCRRPCEPLIFSRCWLWAILKCHYYYY